MRSAYQIFSAVLLAAFLILTGCGEKDEPVGPADSLPERMIFETPTGTEHEMVLVPEGEFTMGGLPGEGGITRRFDEGPKHRVYLLAFAIDRFEVTNEKYQEFAELVGGEVPRFSDEPSYTAWFEPDRPVVGVSWFAAHDYCAWAGLRLPTEAEWEKAARGIDGRAYPWGDRSGDCAGCLMGEGPPLPVGSRADDVSPYGVHDMGFNVVEWVMDWYDHRYYEVSPYRDPPGPVRGVNGWRVARGGSYGWDAFPWGSATGRLRGSPGNRSMNKGFRCAKSVDAARAD